MPLLSYPLLIRFKHTTYYIGMDGQNPIFLFTTIYVINRIEVLASVSMDIGRILV